jgi:peptidoglycan/LPS O-acetylase OafA/YrhL
VRQTPKRGAVYFILANILQAGSSTQLTKQHCAQGYRRHRHKHAAKSNAQSCRDRAEVTVSKRVFPFPEAIHPLTSIRFFLAVGVVLFHYQLMWSLPSSWAGPINKARLSVDIFFILSGFILAHVYLQGDKMPAYRNFLAARFARIYPAHFVILGAMLLLFIGAGLLGFRLNGDHFNLTGFLRTLFLVQAWFPSHTLTNWNGPSWSLSAEWFVYLIFPAFAWIALKLRERPLTMIGLAVAAFGVIDHIYFRLTGIILPDAEDNLGILRIMPEFLLGIGLYYLGQTLNPTRSQSVLAAFLATLALLGAMHVRLDDRIIVALAGPFVLTMGLLAKSGEHGPLSHARLLFWGEASFAIYLIHMPILMVWRNLVTKIFALPHDYLMGAPEMAALLATTLGAGGLLHVFVEHPGRKLIRAALMKKAHVKPA